MLAQELAGSFLCAGSAGLEKAQEGGMRQLAPCLAVSAGGLVDLAGLMEGKERLHLADDLAARGMSLEDLPDPAPEGAGEGKDALSGVILGLVLSKQSARQSVGKALLDLAQGGLTQRAKRRLATAAERGELRQPASKEGGWMGHRQLEAVYIPLY